ncbi:MAG TPA: SgcJ/EcaC family oxidoreductase [Candidatus Limnocylindrales bacterium]|nr:SgcJ/EcaC family oxidoreductase [Candidatus Limnocylindrales bacterium]
MDIEAGRAAFVTAIRAGDAAAAAHVYSDDALLLAPAADVVHGRQAIERFWRIGLEAGIQDVQLDVLEISGTGDVVVEIGAYALRLVSERGTPIEDRGRYLTVHRVQTDGGWRRTAEMFSPDDSAISRR